MTTHSGLSLNQAPPISVPLRFFLTAPLFGLLAATILLGAGPDALQSRWMPATLAATHLVTLGFVSMVMVGAVSQMLPVLAGSPMPRPVLVSSITHVLLSLGTLSLAGGLLLDNNEAIKLAMLLLGLALLLFVTISLYCLARAKAHNPTIAGMWLSVASLLVTVILGLRVAAKHVWYLEPPLTISWTDVHLTWGLLGWVSILIISVAYEVVPMFQMTPHYPEWMQRWLTKLVLSGIVLWAGVSLAPLPLGDSTRAWLAGILASSLAIGLGLFAVMTLYLQRRRRRRVKDVTLQFWHLAMISLLTCALLWLGGQWWPALGEWQNFGYLLTVIYLAGFVVSVINGMLYKIVPFLTWLHLQGQNKRRFSLPNMKEIIPDRRAHQHLLVYTASVPLLVAAVVMPAWFTYPAAILLALAFVMQAFNIFMAVRLYRDISRRLAQAE